MGEYAHLRESFKHLIKRKENNEFKNKELKRIKEKTKGREFIRYEEVYTEVEDITQKHLEQLSDKMNELCSEGLEVSPSGCDIVNIKGKVCLILPCYNKKLGTFVDMCYEVK